MTTHDVRLLVEQGWRVADRNSPQDTVDYFVALMERFPGEAYAGYAYACALDFAGDEAAAHHHFEEMDWPESALTIRLWLITAMACGLGIALVYGEWVTAVEACG